MQKTLTIQDLQQQDERAPIYVVNSAHKSEYTNGTAGEVLLAIAQVHGNGQPTRIAVPQTWLAEELTRHVTRAQILQSNEFLRAVRMGLVTPVSAEWATKLETQTGAKEERQRLRQAQDNVRATAAARTIANSGAIISRADGQKEEDDDSPTIVDANGRTATSKQVQAGVNVAQAAANGPELNNGLSPAFTMWADRLADKNDMMALNDIRARGGMSVRELKYVARVLNPEVHSTSRSRVVARINKIKAKRAA